MDTYQQAVVKSLRAIVQILACMLGLFVILTWSAWPAHAQMHLPPVEYDHPYNGKITVEIVTTAQLRAQCSAATQWSVGCSFPGKDSCRIILLEEKLINAIGWTVDAMLHHERAHCNGWPQSHPGKRPYFKTTERNLP